MGEIVRAFQSFGSGVARGLLFRLIRFTRSVKAGVWCMIYPLPQVIAVGSPADWNLELIPNPIIYAATDSDPSADARGGRTKARYQHFSKNTKRAGPGVGPFGTRHFLPFILGQPLVGLARASTLLDGSDRAAVLGEIAFLEDRFIAFLGESLWFSFHRSRRRAFILVVDECFARAWQRKFGNLLVTAPQGTLFSICPPSPLSGRVAKGKKKVDPGGAATDVETEQLQIREEIHKQALKVGRRSRPPLVQVVKSSPQGKTDELSFGLGDILLGAALVAEEADRSGRLPVIDWTGFHAAGALNLDAYELPQRYSGTSQGVSFQLGGNVPVDFAWKTRVFTNRRPTAGFTLSTRHFLLRNGMSPSRHIDEALNRFLAENKLVGGGFSIAHVRFGDPRDQKRDITSLIRNCALSVAQGSDPLVVLADHPYLLPEFPAGNQVIVRAGTNVHSGHGVDRDQFLETLEDFFLIARSSRVFSLSRYAWGSGFVSSAAQLFEVELTPIVVHRKVFDLPQR